MKNLWSDRDAKAAIASHAKKGIGQDLALRVYSTRLLGGEPRLVLHGGGNTSVKTRMADISGATIDVLASRGPGHGTIEAPGLLAWRGWRRSASCSLRALSDEDMVSQRGNLGRQGAQSVGRDAAHAFLPHKFIDHTHSNAVLR
jgi:rhamnose utilization protein RhaD (predicted bifunctional aldolase and dehydrogenase)